MKDKRRLITRAVSFAAVLLILAGAVYVRGKTKDTEAPGAYDTGCIIVVTEDPSLIREEDTVVSVQKDHYVLRFDTPEEAQKACIYYDSVTRMAAPDFEIGAAGGSDSFSVEDGDLHESLSEGDGADEQVSADLEYAGAGSVISGGRGTLVALIDTGVPPTDSRREGAARVVERVSVLGGDPDDRNGHGTLMLQFLLNENPLARVISIKALDDNGKGTVSSICEAIELAIERDVEVINLSIARYGVEENPVLTEAVNRAVKKGIVVVGAAGNQGADAIGSTPANLENVVAVGALDRDMNLAGESNYGRTVDYYVLSSTTSEAAARFSGIISRSGKLPNYVDSLKEYASEGYRKVFEEVCEEEEETQPGTENTDPPFTSTVLNNPASQDTGAENLQDQGGSGSEGQAGSAGRSTDGTADQGAGRSADGTADQGAGRNTDETADETADQRAGRSTEEDRDQGAEQKAGQSISLPDGSVTTEIADENAHTGAGQSTARDAGPSEDGRGDSQAVPPEQEPAQSADASRRIDDSDRELQNLIEASEGWSLEETRENASTGDTYEVTVKKELLDGQGKEIEDQNQLFEFRVTEVGGTWQRVFRLAGGQEETITVPGMNVIISEVTTDVVNGNMRYRFVRSTDWLGDDGSSTRTPSDDINDWEWGSTYNYSFTFSNQRYYTADLTIKKTVKDENDNVIDDSSDFHFWVTCTSPGGHTVHQTVVARAGGEGTTLPNLDVGSTFTVEETSLPFGYELAGSEGDGSPDSRGIFSGTISEEGAEVTFTNRYVPPEDTDAFIQVTKVLKGRGENINPDDFAFDFCLEPYLGYVTETDDKVPGSESQGGYALSDEEIPFCESAGNDRKAVLEIAGFGPDIEMDSQGNWSKELQGSFGRIRFSKPGYYVYRLYEIIPEEEDPDVTYDRNEYYVVVYVVRETEDDSTDGKTTGDVKVKEMTAWRNMSGSFASKPDLSDIAWITDQGKADNTLGGAEADNGGSGARWKEAVSEEDYYGKVGYSPGNLLDTQYFWNETEKDTFDLTFRKIVAGNAADVNDRFPFTLTLGYNGTSEAKLDNKTVAVSRRNGGYAAASLKEIAEGTCDRDVFGTASVQIIHSKYVLMIELQHTDTVTVSGLPRADTSYYLQEGAHPGYTAAGELKINGRSASAYVDGSGMGQEELKEWSGDPRNEQIRPDDALTNGDVAATITNTKEGPTPTGIVLTYLPYAVLALLGIGGFALLTAAGRRGKGGRER